jgi:hypothetical protein
MKKKLLPSFLFIVSFWWSVVFFDWYFELEFNHLFLEKLIAFELPVLSDVLQPLRVSIFFWTGPLFILIFITTLLGIALSIGIVVSRQRWRAWSVSRKTQWRGIGISMGELPMPEWKVGIKSEYEANVVDKFVSQIYMEEEKEKKPHLFEERHKRILSDILLYIWMNKGESFVGAGHGVDIYEHTLSVLKESWTPGCDPLIPIVASAHDAGKILAYKKHPETQEWEMKGYHDDFGMLIISTMESFDALHEDEKEVLKITVGYGHKESKRPLLEHNIEQRVQNIFAVVNKADRLKTAEEKKKVIEKGNTPQIITDGFLRAIYSAPFQTPSTRRGAPTICFRKQDIVYLLEPGFRDIFLKELPDDLAAAFGDGFRRIGNMSPPTVALINHLKNLGWLVEDGNGMHSECGLWSVEIGKKLFNGVLAVKLPNEIVSKLPDESVYDVRFNCPLKVDIKKDVVAPADRIPSDKLTELQKKARQLSAITGQPVDSLFKKLEKEALEEVKRLRDEKSATK